MSRIFEALRRSEQSEAKNRRGQPVPDNKDSKRWESLLKSLDPRLGNFERIERVTCRPAPEEHVVAMDNNQGAGHENFRLLAHRLYQLRQQRPISKVLITSSVPKEGKTVVVLNLAAILARSSPYVLVVDADMRHPGIHRALGLPVLPGLADFLEDRAELPAVLRRVESAGFYYLPSGQALANPAELLQKPKLQELIHPIATSFDWVIFDSPPLEPFADGHHLSTLSDAVLLVVREGFTPKEAAEQSLAALGNSFVAGIVWNGSTGLSRDYYAYAYASGSGFAPHRMLFTSGQGARPEKSDGQ